MIPYEYGLIFARDPGNLNPHSFKHLQANQRFWGARSIYINQINLSKNMVLESKNDNK